MRLRRLVVVRVVVLLRVLVVLQRAVRALFAEGRMRLHAAELVVRARRTCPASRDRVVLRRTSELIITEVVTAIVVGAWIVDRAAGVAILDVLAIRRHE